MYYYFLQWDNPDYIGKGVANPNTTLDYYEEAGGCPPSDVVFARFTRLTPPWQ